MKIAGPRPKSPGLKNKKVKAHMKTIHAHAKSATMARQARRDKGKRGTR